jgi:MoaA/NifB/PqqE/SkfB family radical SAM enzyme
VDSKTFCIAPWVHTCITPTGKLTPCCVWKGPAEYSFTQFDEWINSFDMQQVRKDLHNGTKIKSCTRCWNDEENGKKSLRKIYNIEFSKYFDFSKLNKDWTADDTVTTLDFKLGNLCNLKCVMCNGNTSSQLMSEYKIHIDKFQKMDYYDVPSTDVNFGWPESREFKEFLDKFKSQARWIKFTGGEPTMIPYVIKLLNEIPNPELVTISITTNAAKLNVGFLNTLKKFKQIWLSVSLDGVDNHNDEIRFLSSWSKVKSNVLKLSTLPNAYFNINYVLQCFSVKTLIPLIQWCDKHQLTMDSIVLTDPEYFTINSVESDIVNSFANELCQMTSTTNQHIIDQTIQELKKYKFDPQLKKQRDEYLLTLDNIRNTDLSNLIK